MKRSRVIAKKGFAAGAVGVSDNQKTIGLWTSGCAITSRRCGQQGTGTGWRARTGSTGREAFAWCVKTRLDLVQERDAAKSPEVLHAVARVAAAQPRWQVSFLSPCGFPLNLARRRDVQLNSR